MSRAGMNGQGVESDALPVGLPSQGWATNVPEAPLTGPDDLDAEFQRMFKMTVDEVIKFVSKCAWRLSRGDKHDAEDLTQDVLVAVLSKIRGNRLGGVKEPRHFLLMITRNRWIDKHRAAAARRRGGNAEALTLPTVLEGAQVVDPAATTALEAVDTYLDIQKILAGLIPEHREAATLLMAGLSATEAARCLGIPVTTYRSRIAAAAREIRRLIYDEGETDE